MGRNFLISADNVTTIYVKVALIKREWRSYMTIKIAQEVQVLADLVRRTWFIFQVNENAWCFKDKKRQGLCRFLRNLATFIQYASQKLSWCQEKKVLPFMRKLNKMMNLLPRKEMIELISDCDDFFSKNLNSKFYMLTKLTVKWWLCLAIRTAKNYLRLIILSKENSTCNKNSGKIWSKGM